MPNSTNPQLNTFSDQWYRVLADQGEIFLQAALNFQAAYAAGGIASLAAADSANTIGNGIPADGRPLVTGTNLTNFKAAVDQVVTAMNSTLVPGVGTTVKAQLDIGQVNGLPR